VAAGDWPAFVGRESFVILWLPACEEVIKTALVSYLQPPQIEIKKEQINASCKTWNQAARQA